MFFLEIPLKYSVRRDKDIAPDTRKGVASQMKF